MSPIYWLKTVQNNLTVAVVVIVADIVRTITMTFY